MSEDIKPKVVAAAIKGNDGIIYTLPPPARHHDIVSYMISQGHDSPFPGGDNQGFLLSDGTFSRRARAKVCAVINDQILPGRGQHHELFSEDLW